MTKVQATSRPDYLWPDVCSNMTKSSQQIARRHWAIEKPKRDNAPKLRVVFFTSILVARKKVAVPLESTMACKFRSVIELKEACGANNPNSRKTRYACIVEAHESARMLNKHIVKNTLLRRVQFVETSQISAQAYAHMHGIYYIDPEDMELEDTMKNVRKVLKMPLESARPRKFCTEHGNTCSIKHDSRRTRYACIIDAHMSTRTRTGKTQSRDHADQIAEKHFNSFSHSNLVHKPLPFLQRSENSGSEGLS